MNTLFKFLFFLLPVLSFSQAYKNCCIDCGRLQSECGFITEDQNTTYTFDFECEDGGLNILIEDSDNTNVYSSIVDLSCHIELVMADEIEDLQDQIDNIDIDDADADPTNELQTLSCASNTITLSDGGGSCTIDPCNTWISSVSNSSSNGMDTWSFTLNEPDCSNSFTVNGEDDYAYKDVDEIVFPDGQTYGCTDVLACLPADLDNDPTNEIQTLTTTPLTLTIDQPCIDARVDANGNIIWQNPNAVHQISTITVTPGNGNNNTGGQEYIVTYPVIGTNHGYHVTAHGGISPNSLNEGDFTFTTNSVRFGFFSGDDGGGVDDADPTVFSILITGCEREFTVIQNVTISN